MSEETKTEEIKTPVDGAQLDDITEGVRLVGDLLQQLQAVKDKSESEFTIANMCTLLVSMRTLKEATKTVNSMASKMYDRLSIGVIPERMEAEEIKNITVEDGYGDSYRLEIRAMMQVSTPKNNQFALGEWFKERGMDDMITPTINGSRLKSMIKNAMEEGDEFPAHLVKMHTYTQAVAVKR